MKFFPLHTENESLTTGHACSDPCLMAVLKAFAETVDRKAPKKMSSLPAWSFNSLFGSPYGNNTSDISDSVGYYKKDETEDEDESEEM